VRDDGQPDLPSGSHAELSGSGQRNYLVWQRSTVKVRVAADLARRGTLRVRQLGRAEQVNLRATICADRGRATAHAELSELSVRMLMRSIAYSLLY
jgi:hypothetical protein